MARFICTYIDAHTSVRERARVCVCEVHRRGGRPGGGRAGRRKRFSSMASGWKGSRETDGDGDRRCRVHVVWRRESEHKKCIAGGRGFGRVQGVSRAPQRRRRFLLININTHTHAQSDRRVVVTAVWPEPPPPCAFVCLLVRDEYFTYIYVCAYV